MNKYSYVYSLVAPRVTLFAAKINQVYGKFTKSLQLVENGSAAA